jgi:hypothetical protein
MRLAAATEKDGVEARDHDPDACLENAQKRRKSVSNELMRFGHGRPCTTAIPSLDLFAEQSFSNPAFALLTQDFCLAVEPGVHFSQIVG